MSKTRPPLQRLYEPRAYDTGAWPDSHWRATAPVAAPRPPLGGDRVTDVAVIGAGYAGLNAALELAGRFGRAVTVLDAGQPGWGASGRNGGFCVMGGTKLSARQIVARFGVEAARDYDRFQVEAVHYVDEVMQAQRIDADRGPDGELCLAHSPRAMRALHDAAMFESETFGRHIQVLRPDELLEMGLSTHWSPGGVLNPVGFSLHPMKYVLGLARAVEAEGVEIFADSPVGGLTRDGDAWRLSTPGGTVWARQVLVATNGYSSDNLPPWIGGRMLPVLSSVFVTRPLSDSERRAQGWSSRIMTFDSRELLHYYRLLPDNRMMFGMRGALRATDAALADAHARARRHMAAMFPHFAGAEVERHWSGLVCITGDLMPFAGAVPGADGVFAGFGWHGNGVSMASYSGARIARVMTGAGDLPDLLRQPPRRFPLPSLRRLGLAAAYAAMRVTDGRLKSHGKARGAS